MPSPEKVCYDLVDNIGKDSSQFKGQHEKIFRGLPNLSLFYDI